MKLSLKSEDYEKYTKVILPYLRKDNNQKYLTIFLTIGASIFFILFAISPTLSTIARLRKEISDSQLLEKKLAQKIDNLSSLNSAYPQVEDDIPLVEDAVPKKPNAPMLVAQIQSLGQEAGININSIDLSPISLITGNATNSSSFNFTVSANGQYSDFSRFLNYLATMQRALTIDSVQINVVDTQTRIVTGTIKGSVFSKK